MDLNEYRISDRLFNWHLSIMIISARENRTMIVNASTSQNEKKEKEKKSSSGQKGKVRLN